MSKRFKDVWESIDANSPKELINNKMECLAAEINYLESIIEIMGADKILERHKKANEKLAERDRV